MTIEDQLVNLDRAMSKGDMGYPDILGRDVIVVWAGQFPSNVFDPFREQPVRCVAVGPLGFVAEATFERNVIGGPVSRNELVRCRRFYPWAGVILDWICGTEPVPTTSTPQETP